MSDILDRLRGYADSRLYALPGQYVCDVSEILNEHAALVTRLTTAERERDEARREREVWEETAAMFSRNEAFYRDLIDTVARSLGAEAFTDDTGAVHDSPIRLRVPELVEALLHRAERAERVVEAAREELHADDAYTIAVDSGVVDHMGLAAQRLGKARLALFAAVRALDAAEADHP